MATPGFKGAVKIKNGAEYVKVAEIKSYSISVSRDTIETTSFDSNGWQEIIPSFASWEGSMDANWDLQGGSTQELLYRTLLDGTIAELEFYVDESKQLKYVGQAYVTGSEVSAEVSDVVSVTFNFTGVGPLDLVQPTQTG